MKELQGFNPKNVYRNLSVARLYEEALGRGEAKMGFGGPLIVNTEPFTGRSPNDRFFIEEPTTKDKIWWSPANVAKDQKTYDNLYVKAMSYFHNRDMFVQDCYAGADSKYRMPLRVITDTAWQQLFSRNMFIREEDPKKLENFKPEFTVISANGMNTIPELDNSNSEGTILINFEKKVVLVIGAKYGGEIKKSIFAVMNFLLPLKGVLSMHCSANIGPSGDTAIFFGLSGTGKTTLSADSTRTLIGDDEHGWSEEGVFNFEGGCYAKVINLSPIAEPDIWKCSHQYGSLLENVVYDEETRKVDFDDGSITLNTRVSYPIYELNNVQMDGKGGHPKNVIMLTADAFGILPPISKLTPGQAMYNFILGYTAKVAGTERGVTEPQATFSTCFGAPFMTLHPSTYAKMLGEKIKKFNSNCWLINTGWTGGPHGEGHRIEIKYTRAMVHAALDGRLDNVEMVKHPVFNYEIPVKVDGVPDEVLDPRKTWKDKDAYDKKAKELAQDFVKNFKKFEEFADDEIRSSGPNV